MKNKLNKQELYHFCEQLSIILRSGMSGLEGLRILSEDNPSPRSREILGALLSDLEENGSLSHALESTECFPQSMISYVKVGEETGCLDEIMQSLTEHYEQEIDISEQIKSAVAYPLIMLGMMAAVIVILLVKVLPVFSQVFRQMGLTMNGISRGLLGVGTSISRYSTVFLILTVLIICCILFFCLHPKGREILLKTADHLPRFREIPVAMDYARLTQGLALGLHSGLGPETSISLAKELVSHPLVSRRLQNAERLLKEGALFSQAMCESELFSGMDARLISIGYQAGAADEVMQKLSLRYRDTSLSLVARFVSVVEPTIVIILSLLVGLVLLSVMMPLLGILSEMII